MAFAQRTEQKSGFRLRKGHVECFKNIRFRRLNGRRRLYLSGWLLIWHYSIRLSISLLYLEHNTHRTCSQKNKKNFKLNYNSNNTKYADVGIR